MILSFGKAGRKLRNISQTSLDYSMDDVGSGITSSAVLMHQL